MAANNLRDIRAFPELVRYLEDELDWPLQEYGFDELTFEFTPAELGLKEEDAARIKTIHQLRPLASGQPWGIFFVEFENKKLPVVVLRRILSHLVIKKRASANKASAPAWHAEDLLFVTAFGEDGTDAREIAFAHFHQNPGDLPTLHVLGWDGGNTPLTLARIDHTLRERLHWPEDESDADAWRDAWRKPFKHRIGHIIQTADLLAEELAKLARGIRDKANRLLAAESERGVLTKLFKAFQAALIHDLTPESFADTYAQTITYGLLTAAISRTEMSEGRFGTFVKADDIADIVPVTNPFLKEMLQTFLKAGGRKGGIDFDELGIQDVVELLRGEETDLPAVIADFGNKNPNEDPVIHFYEHFLAAYDKPQKKQRGVFYTPQPVVGYIVRSVHELLQTEFGLEDGLASTITWGEMAALHLMHNSSLPLPPGEGWGEGGVNSAFNIPEGTSPDSFFVTILDPATGTATFLVEVISVIHHTLTEKWKKQGMSETQRQEAWNDYVPAHLLPRLFGYELMMAPYAIAHMKIGLKLHETGYRFGSEERVRVYLTNALEPAHEVQPQLEVMAPALAHEAQAVAEVKRVRQFTVVVGNPPYAGHSWNLTSELRKIVDPYRFVGTQRIKEKGALQLEKSIQDDYIKFFRFGQCRIEHAGAGVLGLVTSHGFLDNPFLRGMRSSLLTSFEMISVLDLHGNGLKHEKCPDGSPDKNVFDINRSGVAISLCRKYPKRIGGAAVLHANLWGDRESKYPWLRKNSISTTTFSKLLPRPNSFLLVSYDTTNSAEYECWYSVGEIMPVHSKGLVTGRDAFVIDFDKTPLVSRMSVFAASAESDSDLIEKYHLNPTPWWPIDKARRAMPAAGDFDKYLKPILYRPFDTRVCFYHPAVFMSPRRPVMRHVDSGHKNILLITSRMTKGESFAHIAVTRGLAEAILLSSKTSNNAIIFPLHLYPDAEQGTSLSLENEPIPNFTREFVAAIARSIGVPIKPGIGDYQSFSGSENLAHYLIAILHSPTYRSRYADQLSRDFPRIPIPCNLSLFQTLATVGGELVAFHLLESPKVNDFITRFEGNGDNSIPKKPIYKDGAVWINASQRFEGVPEAVWNFHIGGYQVCEKWLKDRKGRTLSADDIAHYQRVVVALNETIRLMAEIDRVIETHGGWPGAFQASADEVAK